MSQRRARWDQNIYSKRKDGRDKRKKRIEYKTRMKFKKKIVSIGGLYNYVFSPIACRKETGLPTFLLRLESSPPTVKIIEEWRKCWQFCNLLFMLIEKKIKV